MNLERFEGKKDLPVIAAKVYKNSLMHLICLTVLQRTKNINYRFNVVGIDEVREMELLELSLGNAQQKFIFDFEVAKMEEGIDRLSHVHALFPSRIFSNTKLINEKLGQVYRRIHKRGKF